MERFLILMLAIHWIPPLMKGLFTIRVTVPSIKVGKKGRVCYFEYG